MRKRIFISIFVLSLTGIIKPLNAQGVFRYYRSFDPHTFQFSDEVTKDTLKTPCLKVRFEENRPVSMANFVDIKYPNPWARARHFYYKNSFIMEIDTIPAPGPDNFLLFNVFDRDTLVSLKYISPKKCKKPKWRLFSAFMEFESGDMRSYFLYRKNVKWDLPTENVQAINIRTTPLPYSIQLERYGKIEDQVIRSVSCIIFNEDGGIEDMTQVTECLIESNPPEKRWLECEELKK